VNRSLSNGKETHCGMEGIGGWVGRVDIHFTDHPRMSCVHCRGKKVQVEKLRNPLPALRLGDNDAIDVDKRLARRFKPREVWVFVGSVVIERNQERGCAPFNAPGVKSYAEQRGKTILIER